MSDRKFIIFGLRIVGEFGATIAVPVVLFSWIGKQLDSRFGTSPWLYIFGFILAALISGFAIWKKAKKIGKEYQKMIDADTRESTARNT